VAGTRESLPRFGTMPVQEIKSSSAIERVAYSSDGGRLSVWFKGGRRYVYSGVPADVHRALCAADSIGRYLNAHIKGRYPCRAETPRRINPFHPLART
jgi:hypothetical protein